ncbi:hypothetical protein QBC38DRAFT_195973 [Podospora fimiseda]|uniref:J domain-containing protein n=1 Tax=Podospora fimiseda TaxID=252190 RepID=A0AAN7BQK4_9PEZI|nr:hypothetical protein QBC38DRAFT_195973 [Podospora fimiseda]
MSLKSSRSSISAANALVTSSSALRGPTALSQPIAWWRRPSSSPRGQQMRSYASVQETPLGANGNANNAPPNWPTSANPTPYEIFGFSKDAPYSKARFSQLVKLYHPDLHHHNSHDGIPHMTKLDRYRLVILANDILSNPEKRRKYDLYNIGWDKVTDPAIRCRAADRAWRQEPGNASRNATWEDWERWHQQRDGRKQEPVFASNGSFAALILIFVVAGTWTQVVYAGNHSLNMMDKRDQLHANVSRDLRLRNGETYALSKEGRVDHFLRQREYEKWGYDPPGHLLPASSVLPKR